MQNYGNLWRKNLSNAFGINKPITVELKELILEEVKFRGNSIVPKYVANAKFTQYEDFYLDAVVVSCEVAVAGIKDSNTTQTDLKTTQKNLARYPATILEFFKEKYAPNWVKEKYPVKYVEYYQNITTVTETTRNITKVFPDIFINNHKEILRIYENRFTSC